VNDVTNPVVNKGFNYTFDNIGNRTSSQILGDLEKTYASNGLNQYASITDANSSMSPVFDDDGNLIEDSKFTYTWNGENRLIKVTPKAFEEGAVELHFVYDYQGRRVSKERRIYNPASMKFEFEKRIEYIFDGWNVILEKATEGSPATAGTETHYFHYDANGNVTETVDSNGDLTASYKYGPFGELVNEIGTYAQENAYKFSTKPQDIETGYYYYGFRFYDSSNERWLNRDPIGEKGGTNIYAAVLNAPINYFDKYGLSVSTCFQIIRYTLEFVGGVWTIITTYEWICEDDDPGGCPLGDTIYGKVETVSCQIECEAPPCEGRKTASGDETIQHSKTCVSGGSGPNYYEDNFPETVSECDASCS
jgi:RHS repeat-associated protein